MGDEAAVAATEQAEVGNRRQVVVGIGASAGGLEALAQMLAAAPQSPGMSFVVVQHLSPDHESALAEILRKRTKLPIRQVEGPSKVEPNCIYVIPPGKYLSIESGTLKLSEPEAPRGLRMAIDYFLRSLAQDTYEYGVGVILSGTGSDGTTGLQEIKEHGGLTVVQDPEDASHRGMPASAIESVAVDLVLPASQIVPRLVHYVQHASQHGPLSSEPDPARFSADLNPIFELLRRETDHDFRSYRRNTLLRRIQRRMGLHGMEQFGDYTVLLQDGTKELQALRRDLLIGVTRFFRNPEAWQALNDKVIEPLVQSASRSDTIRIWCPGCATGEEAYSLAMLVHENVDLIERKPQFQIFATDVADDALEIARAGRYSDAIVADVSMKRLRRFFVKDGGAFRVSSQLRESVVFAEQNVLAQPPFSTLDLISCRNLLIYLRQMAQQRVMSVFQFALKAQGVLFLGSSESVDKAADLFDPIDSKWRIYRRTGVRGWSPPSLFEGEGQASSSHPPVTRAKRRQKSRLASRVHRQLLRESEQGIAVINRQNRVLFLEGRADLYLQLNLGEFTTELPDILTLARDGLKARLRTVLYKALKSGDPIEDSCRVERSGQSHRCRIRARHLDGGSGDDAAMLVTFESGEDDESPAKPLVGSTEKISGDPTELQHELLTTREQLSTSIAQLETANEELKATNEEALTMNEQLQTSNEELETSKEELQSLNEELTTLNQQLELKLNELQHTTDDLNNLLSSASIPTIFLDTDLRIRRFTPSCQGLFNFISSDVGRQLSDITIEFDDQTLNSDCEAVLDDLLPREKQVQTTEGNVFTRRILPYRTEDRRIQGVVVTFSDVTELCRAQNEAARNLAVLRTIYKSAPIGMSHLTTDLDYLRINDELAAINGYPAEDHIGKNIRQILPSELAHEVVALHRRAIDSGESLLGVEIFGKTAATQEDRVFSCSFVPVRDEMDQVVGVSTIVQDVTAQKRYESELSDSRSRLEMALSAGRMGIWHWNLHADKAWWSEQMCRIFGIDQDEFHCTRDSFINRVHPEDRQQVEQSLREALEEGIDTQRIECRILRDRDHEVIWVEVRATVLRDSSGQPIAMTGITTDVTERHQYQERLQKARDAAEAANRARGEFLANMSHEIRTPMTAIIGYADMLSGHLKDPDNLQCVQTIRRNGRFLLEIIDDILDLSKIDAGRMRIETEEVAPQDVVADIVSLMNVRAEEKQLNLKVEFDGMLPEVIETDAKRLRQILLNLVGNAVKFTDEGTVRLLVRHVNDVGKLEFSVIDTGIGIQEDSIDQLFQPFVQADASVTRSFGGTGLGLTISRRLARVLGGDITVKSRIGRGSTFTLCIDPGPLEGTEFIKPNLHIQDSKPAGQTPVPLDGHFLIVDDRRDIRYLAQHFIEQAGGVVSTANDGDEAVEMVKRATEEQRPYAAILMDMQMPVMDGYQATSELRDRGIDIPIIALTANAMDGDKLKCLEVGCTAFISKPIDRSELFKQLQRLSGKSHREIRQWEEECSDEGDKGDAGMLSSE